MQGQLYSISGSPASGHVLLIPSQLLSSHTNQGQPLFLVPNTLPFHMKLFPLSIHLLHGLLFSYRFFSSIQFNYLNCHSFLFLSTCPDYSSTLWTAQSANPFPIPLLISLIYTPQFHYIKLFILTWSNQFLCSIQFFFLSLIIPSNL